MKEKIFYNKICISNRRLLTGTSEYSQEVHDQILERIGMIARGKFAEGKLAEGKLADAVILREKDLSEEDYRRLALDVSALCREMDFPLILHHFPQVAVELGLPLHLSMEDFRKLDSSVRQTLPFIGVSTHSVEEALEAERLGASYLTASHIFPTECKPGLAPRGLLYLQEVCERVQIPVYALGGIHEKVIPACMEAGAAGVCMMSEYFGG